MRESVTPRPESSRSSPPPALTLLTATGAQAASAQGARGTVHAAARAATIYVVNQGGNTVTPINATTWKPGPPIKVGNSPGPIAITPNGATVYVALTSCGCEQAASARTEARSVRMRP